MLSFGNLGKRGRLGNALYQLASTVGLARQIGERPLFNADWIHRPYFSVPDEMFADISGDGTMAAVYGATLPPGPTSQWRVDYLQDFALFADILPEIRRLLAPAPGAAKVLQHQYDFHALPRPILSVHVRRGDNVIDPGVRDKHLYWPVPSFGYYMAAIDEMRGRFKPASVAVFSDDIAWCVENIPADYYHRGVTRPKEHESDYLTAPVLDWIDLQLSALCDHHILSNSTFGWWAAILAGDPDALYPWPVVGPKLPHVDMRLALAPAWRRRLANVTYEKGRFG